MTGHLLPSQHEWVLAAIAMIFSCMTSTFLEKHKHRCVSFFQIFQKLLIWFCFLHLKTWFRSFICGSSISPDEKASARRYSYKRHNIAWRWLQTHSFISLFVYSTIQHNLINLCCSLHGVISSPTLFSSHFLTCSVWRNTFTCLPGSQQRAIEMETWLRGMAFLVNYSTANESFVLQLITTNYWY